MLINMLCTMSIFSYSVGFSLFQHSYSAFMWRTLSNRKSQETEYLALDKTKMSCSEKLLSVNNKSVPVKHCQRFKRQEILTETSSE